MNHKIPRIVIMVPLVFGTLSALFHYADGSPTGVPGAGEDPVENIDMGLLRAVGTPREDTAVYGVDETPKMRVSLRNLNTMKNGAAVTAKLRWTVRTHPQAKKVAFKKIQKVSVPPGKKKTVTKKLPLQHPGPYRVRVRLLSGKKTLQKDRLGILFHPDAYKPPLTRPDDFETFWQDRLTTMREIPFEPELHANEAYDTKHYKGYDLVINGHDGKPLNCVLMVPRDDPPYDAMIGGGRQGKPGAIQEKLKKAADQPAGVGMWEKGARRLRLFAPTPGNAEFTRWNGRGDNNMLNCYLQRVRLTDYLRSRTDVRHIWLFGASRGGPINLVTAALAPKQVAAVNVHVPTSMGLSWSKPRYTGWGRPPSYTEQGLKTAAYFDPVNFAPDLEVPVVMDGGFYDGLAPIPGMIAFCNHAENAPFARYSIEQGQHGHFKKSARDELEAALAEHLVGKGIVPGEYSEASEQKKQ